MSDRFALTGARIFDGDDWHDDAALVVRDGFVEAIVPSGAIDEHYEPRRVFSAECVGVFVVAAGLARLLIARHLYV